MFNPFFNPFFILDFKQVTGTPCWSAGAFLLLCVTCVLVNSVQHFVSWWLMWLTICSFVLFTYELKISLENLGVCDLDLFRPERPSALSALISSTVLLHFIILLPELKDFFATKDTNRKKRVSNVSKLLLKSASTQSNLTWIHRGKTFVLFFVFVFLKVERKACLAAWTKTP